MQCHARLKRVVGRKNIAADLDSCVPVSLKNSIHTRLPATA
jgi:hypothetical protein